MQSQRNGEEHVVITGASGKLGRVLLRYFVKSGARVTAIVRRTEDVEGVISEVGRDVLVLPADLASDESVRLVFDEVVERVGPPDALIHTVGTWAETPLDETSTEAWLSILTINLTTTYLCFREGARVMAGRSGRLIAFSSAQGVDGGMPRQSAYSCSKAAVERLVQSMDLEFSDRGIMAFTIAPSTIIYDAETGGRGVLASDIAEACGFLMTDSARSLRGSTLRLYGDRA